LVYVAFTRCEDKLFVYTASPSSSSRDSDNQLNNFNKILNTVFTSNEFEFKQNYSEEEMALTIGDLNEKCEHEKAKPDTNIINNYFNQPYQDKIQIRPENDNYSEILDDEKAKKIQMGIKVHYVLERLSNLDGLEGLLWKLIREKQIDKEDFEPIDSQIRELFKNDIFKNWFEPNWTRHPEEFIFSGNEMYKPDLVLVDMNKNSAIVVDYKKQVKDEKHDQQIQQYGSILSKMGKYESIELFLVYVADSEILRVDSKMT